MKRCYLNLYLHTPGTLPCSHPMHNGYPAVGMLHSVSPSPGRMRGSAGGANSGAAAARSSHLHPERDTSARLQQLSHADRVAALAGHEQRRGPVLSEQTRRRVSERDWAVGTGRAAMMRCGYVTGKSSNGGGSVLSETITHTGQLRGLS